MPDSDKTILGKLETIKHIGRVRHFLCMMIEELDARARAHDQSKLESPEAEIFGEFGAELPKVEYDSPAYKELLAKIKPALDHHYANNRHHTEFFADGINGMDMIDVLEMLVDWKASSERNKAGNIRKSLEINAKRYGISDQLKTILSNTIDRYF